MNRLLLLTVLAALSLLICLQAGAGAVGNVALGKAVTLHGGPFFEGGWGGGMVVDPETIVDGVFLPRSTQWDQGPVWWDRRDHEPAYITIDLGGTYSIESFVVQADDNDWYTLSVWDRTSGDWQVAWDIPAVGGWGMQTRPNPSNDSERYLLAAPLATDKLKFEGPGPDLYLSVSEIQAYGNSTPELATWVLLASGGLVGIALRRRRKT